MAKLPAPAGFDFAHPEKWEDWIKRFERFRIGSKLDKEDGSVQVNCLIYTMGEQAEGIFSTMTLSEEDSTKYQPVVEAYKKHFTPKANPVHWRSILRRRFQGENENIEAYVRALFDIATKCAFTDKNIEIRDQVVIGIRDKEVSKDLQSDANLTLENAIAKARQEESLKLQVKSQTGESNTGSLDAMVRPKRQFNRPQNHHKTSRPATKPSENCGNCGLNHPPRKCPAFNKTCTYCKKLGHLMQVCRSRKFSKTPRQSEISEHDMSPLPQRKTQRKSEYVSIYVV